MTPTEFRSGGDNTEIKFAIGESSLGLVLIAASDKGVCAIFFGDDPARSCARSQKAVSAWRGSSAMIPLSKQLAAKVIGFVEDPRVGPRPSLGYSRHRLSASRMAGAPPHSAGRDGELCGHRQGDRGAESGARSSPRLRLEPHRRGDSLPSRDRVGWVADRLSRRHRAQARSARPKKPSPELSARGLWRRGPAGRPASARPACSPSSCR